MKTYICLLYLKSTNYICLDFGAFVCFRCARIFHNLNYKVKDIGITIFNEKKLEIKK